MCTRVKWNCHGYIVRITSFSIGSHLSYMMVKLMREMKQKKVLKDEELTNRFVDDPHLPTFLLFTSR